MKEFKNHGIYTMEFYLVFKKGIPSICINIDESER
jgi:hypothetical protein